MTPYRRTTNSGPQMAPKKDRMTKRRVWRYYCAFCKKGGLSSYWMRKHELACTANPDRVCGVCRHAGFNQKPLSVLRACLNTRNPIVGMEDLRDLSENCPACILAALRQAGILKFDPESPPPDINFDFKAEIKDFWQTQNDAAYEAERNREWKFY